MPKRRTGIARRGVTRGTTAGSGTIDGIPAEIIAAPASEGPVLLALYRVAAGVPEEEVAKSLDWRDFERFCAQLLRANGYSVEENVHLRRPRAQLDLVATGPFFVINLDCKHWKRAPSYAALRGFALAQLKRSRLLRQSMGGGKPIVSAILSFSESKGEFIEGVAVVPIRAVRSFLETVESYSEVLEAS